jgi:hypothetical protein
MKINHAFKASAFILLSAVILFSACSKIATLNLTKTYSDIEFTIKAPQAAGTFTLEKEVQSDLQQLASEYGFDIMDTDPMPVTFDIVDNATCEFFADGASVTEVGTDDATQTSPSQMDFDLKGVDVTPYLKSTTFKVRVKLTTNAPITHDVPMKASLQFSFKVKPLK